MTFRYSKKWASFDFAVALAMSLALYLGLQPKWWGGLLFSPLFLYMVLESVRKSGYSVTVDGDRISVASFESAQYLVSEIAAIDVWVAKGGRIAVVGFADRSKLSFSSRLAGFDELVQSLRTKANLPEPS